MRVRTLDFTGSGEACGGEPDWSRLVEMLVPDDSAAPAFRRGERVLYDPGARAGEGDDVVIHLGRRREIATLVDVGRLRLTLLKARKTLRLAPSAKLHPIRARRP